MPFQPFRIPFDQGLKQDYTSYDADKPNYLLMADNVIFTQKGSLLGRPGLVNEDAVVQNTTNSGGAAIQNSTTLNGSIGSLVPAGIESSDDGIMALYQGQAYIKSHNQFSGNTPWKSCGPVWATKKYTSPFLDYRNVRFPNQVNTALTTYNTLITSVFSQTNLGGLNITAPTAVGSSVVSVPVVSNSSVSLPIIAQDKVDLLDTQTLTNYDVVAQCNVCICNTNNQDIIIYPNTAGGLFLHNTQPATVPGLGTETQIEANGSVFIQNNVAQSIWCCAGAPGTSEVYIAYVSSSTQITVIRVNTSASVAVVTATLVLTAGTPGHGVTLCSNKLNVGVGAKLCLGYMDTSATNRYITRILLVNSTSSITDASLLVQHGVGLESSPIYRGHTVGLTHVGTIAVCYVTNTAPPRKTNIDIRSFSSTTNFVAYSLFDGWDTSAGVSGAPNTTLYQQNEWKPFVPANSFCGRTIMGVYRELNAAAGFIGGTAVAPSPTSQWFILDISTNLPAANVGVPVVIAHSPLLSCYTTPPVNAFTSSNVVTFGVVSAIDFDDLGIVDAGGQMIRLQATAARSCVVNGSILVTNSTMYEYDGIQMAPLGFVEEAPNITGLSIFTPTGIGAPTPVSGSFSLQAIWEVVNGRGQVIRSAQSNKVTTPRPLISEAISLTVSAPQLCGRYLTPGSRLVIKVYCTTPNPPANAPLYLVSANDVRISAGVPVFGTSCSGTGLLAHNSVGAIQAPATTPDAEQLYTGGGVFDDQMPSSADRGIAFINGRVWTADEDNIYISKLLTNQFGIAFNLNSDKLIIPMPTSIGAIQALGELADKMAVIGTLGTAYIYGSGFDDLGNGTGWLVQTTSQVGTNYFTSLASQLGPRLAVNIPSTGVAFLGNTSDIYLMDFSGNVQIISRPTIDTIVNLSELSYWTAGVLSPNSQINHGAYLVGTGSKAKLMDIETGRWCTWSPAVMQSQVYTASFNGKLWLQGADNSTGNCVYSFIDETGNDLSLPYSMTVVHNSVSITGQLDNGMVNVWGRLRSMTILGSSLNNNAFTLAVRVQPDKSSSSTVLLNKSVTIGPTNNSTWPYTNLPEFRATIQRCGSFTTSITVTPAIMEIAGIECWATVTGDRNPSSNRL